MSRYIITSDGQRFYFTNPENYKYSVKGIAASLSKLCRFTGHTRNFYSVAEHAVLVSKLVPKEYSLWGLLHDAHEAFIGDIASPLKAHIGANISGYEHRIDAALCKSLNIPYPSPMVHKNVKDADLVALAIEAFYLMPTGAWEEFDFRGMTVAELVGCAPAPVCLPPRAAERAFLDRYAYILECEASGFKVPQE